MEEDSRLFNRYKRQISISEIGLEGQKKIEKAKVLLIGVGGLGSSAAYYLAASGIGRIGIVDDDIVQETNLNRQILHNPDNIGKMKVASAKETLVKFNNVIDILIYPKRLETCKEIIDVIIDYDIVIDCTDNFSTRVSINDACIKANKPWVYGAVYGFEGQAMTIIPGRGPCYRCLYPSTPLLTSEITPVIGVSPGIIGVVQAAEALKYILGKGSLLVGRLLFIDLLNMHLSAFKVERNINCQSCSDRLV
jgi:molybdopterin/thiamine biosynthesis adenylyltransferase